MTTHNMLDADLLCDRVAFLAEGRIAALDTPERLKVQYSKKRVKVIYQKDGERTEKELMPDMLGLPFPADCMVSIHSQEPTLEEVFLKTTGRGLDG